MTRENWSSEFPTRSNTNQYVQSQEKARSLKFQKKRDCTICVVKTKVLIWVFVFVYAKVWLSHDVAYIMVVLLLMCTHSLITLL